VGGLLWQQKGRPGVLEHTNIAASLRRQQLEILLLDQDKRIMLQQPSI